jgi:threonine dehydratase
MLAPVNTPLVRLNNVFANREVYAKCEFLAPSGCFKIHGANHLLESLSRTQETRLLVVPSMGNTALGAAVGARAFGFQMVGVVPEAISRDKDEKLRALGVELIKIAGGGSELLGRARQIADERGGYFVHPHLDPRWTDGYRTIAEQILHDLPDCRSLIFPVGGGGLLMGLTEVISPESEIALFGCEAYNFPTYAAYRHERSRTIADGLMLDVPHVKVQQRIADRDITLHLVSEAEIREALRALFVAQGLIVEPSSAITLALAKKTAPQLEEPICLVLTGGNIARDDFDRLIGPDGGSS